jgi:EF-P beta-lysylation protein EpmB
VNWQEILKTNLNSFEELCVFLQLNKEQKAQLLQKAPFVLNLPLRLACKIQKGTLDDPILNQFVAKKLELEDIAGFVQDPTQDQDFKQTNKLLKKYASRVLILTTSSCAMHCRFCFRKNFPYETKEKNFEQELEYLKKDTSIEEVILSGGDPLSLSDKKLEQLITQLEAIPHLKRLRLHSRFIIGVPERVTDQLLHTLEKSRFQIWFVLHCNHPLEIDGDVEMAVKKLQKLGIGMLSQSVLLKNINDDFETLKSLCQKLINCGIKPYYLHQLDQVEGTQHFFVDTVKGKDLIAQLHQTMSGYAVPEFVQEEPFKPAKTKL